MNYLVNFDKDGRLRWARNDELVDTTAGKWQNSDDGSGIIPYDGGRKDKPILRRTSFEAGAPRRQGRSIMLSSPETNEAAKSAGNEQAAQGSGPLTRLLKSSLTLSALSSKLLRRAVKKESWIYVTASGIV